VPVGTAVFTHNKYAELKNADITCLDYSPDMLEQAKKKDLKRTALPILQLSKAALRLSHLRIRPSISSSV